MKPAEIEAAKVYAYKLWELEKEWIRTTPSSNERYLLKNLVRLEDKPVEHRTEGEQWEIEAILEQLADRPPYRKQSRPLGPVQPLRFPQNATERMAQMDPHIRYAERSLEHLLKEFGAGPGTTFQVVDGEAATRARFPKPQPKVGVFARFGRWLKTFFAHKPKAPELETLEAEVAHAINEAEKTLNKE